MTNTEPLSEQDKKLLKSIDLSDVDLSFMKVRLAIKNLPEKDKEST